MGLIMAGPALHAGGTQATTWACCKQCMVMSPMHGMQEGPHSRLLGLRCTAVGRGGTSPPSCSWASLHSASTSDGVSLAAGVAPALLLMDVLTSALPCGVRLPARTAVASRLLHELPTARRGGGLGQADMSKHTTGRLFKHHGA